MTTPATAVPLSPSSIPAVIIAGGRSLRMGSNKAVALLGGRTLLSHVASRLAPQVAEIALNADPGWPEATGMATELRLVPDTMAEKAGPLAGVLAAMRDAARMHPAATHVATVPIDSPFLPATLVADLAGAIADPETIAIATSGGRDHPVFGLWPVSLADRLETWLVADGKRRVRDVLALHATLRVDFPLIETSAGPLDPFFNVNTPDDLAAAQHWLELMPS